MRLLRSPPVAVLYDRGVRATVLVVVLGLAACAGSVATVAGQDAPLDTDSPAAIDAPAGADAPPVRDAPPPTDVRPVVDAAPSPDAGAGPLFPLRRAPAGRSLVDASGRPFLLQGDAAWSLIVQLDDADLEEYLAARQAKGFNTLLVNLVEHHFADQPPKDAFGNAPFTTAGDFSTPNPAYFAHVDAVLERARAHGFLVLLAFAYLGYNGGNEGWYQELSAESAAVLRGYGAFLGARYHDQPNIVWVAGGDYNPPNKDIVRQLVDGIRSADTGHFITVHCSRGTGGLEYWAGETWIDLDTVYSGADAASPSAAAYARSALPFFLIEAYYEHENGVSPAALRGQSYGALLAGAMGQIYGNGPMWCFGPADCFNWTGPPAWKPELDSRGARDMAVLKSLFDSVPWPSFTPTTNLVTTGGSGAVASLGGGVALVYVPTSRAMTIDVSKMPGTTRALWVDPVSGARTAAGGPWAPTGTQGVPAPGQNAGGDGDWVLLLDSR